MAVIARQTGSNADAAGPGTERSGRDRREGTWSGELQGVLRAVGGGFIFATPLLYTMEMWWIGSTAELWKLMLFLGVAALTAIGTVRVVFGWSMRAVVSGVYLLALVLVLFTPDGFVPLAFDSGSVTTGVLTAPVVIALAMGLSSVLAGRSAVSDGFGIVGLASAGPIVAVLLMGLLW